jgi:heptosyltransferase III
MRKILVLRGGALGDFIVTLPALALLRQRWPDAQIELVGNATAAEIARKRGLINAAHSQHEARWSACFSAAPLTPALATWFADFDLVVSYWPDPEGEMKSHFPTRPGQVFLTAEAMPTIAPAAAHYCRQLQELGLQAESFFCRIDGRSIVLGSKNAPPTHAVDRPTADNIRRQIVIHPGSGSPRKNWPADRWLELMSGLPGPILLLLGEAEAEAWSSTVPQRDGVSAVVMPTLEGVIPQLVRCRLFLGHDSGISHLAAGCGAPCVLLFGPTDPAIWAPPAPNVQVLRRGNDLKSISVDDVRDAVAAALADRT